MSRPTPQHRYVYVVGPLTGLQKIGIATDPKQRLATLQTAVPFDLHLHLALQVPFADAHAIERRAHRALARACVRNEWFEATSAEAVAAVKAAAAPRTAEPSAAPREWRTTPADASPLAPPAVSPLLVAGRQFRPKAAFHKAAEPAPLPLFDYARPKVDEQAMMDRALDVLVKRTNG